MDFFTGSSIRAAWMADFNEHLPLWDDDLRRIREEARSERGTGLFAPILEALDMLVAGLFRRNRLPRCADAAELRPIGLLPPV
jgi:hypothetical protein